MAYDEHDEEQTKARTQTRTLDYHEAMKADTNKRPVNMSGVMGTSGQVGAGGVEESRTTLDDLQSQATLGDDEGNVSSAASNPD
jgi:hypothetical protein